MTWRALLSIQENQPITEQAEERARGGRRIRTTLCPPSTTTKLHTPADAPAVFARSDPVTVVVKTTEQDTTGAGAASVSPLLSPNSYTYDSSTLETQRSATPGCSSDLLTSPKSPAAEPEVEVVKEQTENAVHAGTRTSDDTEDLLRFVRERIDRVILERNLLEGQVLGELRDQIYVAVSEGCKGM